MPAYNAILYVREAIASIRTQTYQDFELIIIDDGSTDATAEACRKAIAGDPRCRLISRPNTGIVGALNDGFAVARCTDYIARMDADDVAEPERFHRQVEYLETNPDCVAVGCRAFVIDPDGDPICLVNNPPGHAEIEKDLFLGLGGAILHPSVMIQREAFVRVNGYDPRFQLVEDLDLYLKLGEIGRLANLPDVLLKYRLHLASTNVVKRDLQFVVGSGALQEAYRRRGLPGAPFLVPDVMLTAVGIRARWGYMAIAGGHYRTAIKYAIRCVARQPWKPAWWRLLGAAAKRLLRSSFQDLL